MQWCRANAFLCCLSATTIQKRVSLSGQQPIRLVHLFVTQWLWVFLLGPAPFAFCFSAGWRSAYLAGGSAFRPLWFVFVVFCAVDLPSYTEPQSVIGRTGGKKKELGMEVLPVDKTSASVTDLHRSA